MGGVLLASSVLAYLSAQWGHRNRHMRAVRAFKAGMAPIAVALLVATGWVLAGTQATGTASWRPWSLRGLVTFLVCWTRLHLLWLLAAGAVLCVYGWVWGFNLA